MADSSSIIAQPLVLSDKELKYVIDLVYSRCGIALNQTKKRMASARISKRLRMLGLKSFSEYFDYLNTPEGETDEMASMIDVITTNTTQFFRESHHFEFLVNKVLPEIIESGTQRFKIWSAGCSSGEEAYTIAMVLADYFEKQTGNFSIIATDISTRMLSEAKRAIYEKAEIESVPKSLIRKYLMRGKGSQIGNYRVVPELRQHISFCRLNLVDRNLALDEKMDIIFCRNVTIYFDNPTKKALFKRFYDNLKPGGFFFIGHSETLNGFNSDFIQVAPTIYRKPKSELAN